MPKKRDYPGCIRANGSGFQLILTVAGERHYYQFETRAEAEDFADPERKRLRRLAETGAPSELRMSELLDRYERSQLPTKAPNTARSYKADLAALRRYFVDERGDPKANGVRPLHVQEFVDWRSRTAMRKGETK